MLERLILHAGTPKTGTTSLQITLDQNRDVLAKHGLLYPNAIPTAYVAANRAYDAKPKHQWLVNDLMAASASSFLTNMKGVFDEVSGSVNTIILSTEGLFNHWWDFSAAGRAALSDLAARYRLEVWVWFRNPVDFFISHYIQMLKNPRSEVACHGQDWSPEDMLDDPWFAKRLNYIDFVDQTRALLGVDAVRIFPYAGTTVYDFFLAFDLCDMKLPELQENASFGDFGISALRLLNQREIPFGEKYTALELIARADAVIGAASLPLSLAAATRARVLELCETTLTRFEHELGINLLNC